ncbi:MAG: hypothetical protein Q9214_000356, partial [Letrouitia sp. 1 TL-2023]
CQCRELVLAVPMRIIHSAKDSMTQSTDVATYGVKIDGEASTWHKAVPWLRRKFEPSGGAVSRDCLSPAGIKGQSVTSMATHRAVPSLVPEKADKLQSVWPPRHRPARVDTLISSSYGWDSPVV